METCIVVLITCYEKQPLIVNDLAPKDTDIRWIGFHLPQAKTLEHEPIQYTYTSS